MEEYSLSEEERKEADFHFCMIVDEVKDVLGPQVEVIRVDERIASFNVNKKYLVHVNLLTPDIAYLGYLAIGWTNWTQFDAVQLLKELKSCSDMGALFDQGKDEF